jgi:hypothetical protein
MQNKLNLLHFLILFLATSVLSGCRNKLEEKGFPVASDRAPAMEAGDNKPGISRDSMSFATKPGDVLLTGSPQVRIATIYKVNYNRDSSTFIGSTEFHFNYASMGESPGNQWNNHLLPGFEAVYGYNLVNVAHYDTKTQERKNFFTNPVLIKTLYFPSFSRDTLNHDPVHRDYFMISTYDEDTNKDGFVNVRDLRRLYYFDTHAGNKRNLVPTNYSVYKSEYDPGNDYIFVFAQLDENKNGMIDDGEIDHIFWINLKDPSITGRQY